jgi:murein DD-endopeptidase MepM/ murein hydrolase activator NlpD
MRCKNSYKLPIKKEHVVDWSKIFSPAHKWPYNHSLDFLCEEGTPVYAAASGVVVWLKDKSNEGGLSRSRYWNKGNRIVIKHRNGEYTAYEHLFYRSAVVKIGEKVRKGQLIGYSGNTGWSMFPHLHFEVFNEPVEDESEGITMQVVFDELRH